MGIHSLLILDLDETLIHATSERLARTEDFRAGQYNVYKRPCLDDFLEFAFENFEVAVWTSSTQKYADCVCSHIFGARRENLKFIFSRTKCTLKAFHTTGQEFHVKRLKKVFKMGFDKNRVLCVDDDPEKYHDNYGNLIVVTPFFGDENDNELALLASFLGRVKDRDDVRLCEKRGWKNQLSTEK